MMSLFFITVSSLIPAEECPKYSKTSCTNCLESIGNLSCGWCSDTNICIPGDMRGPFIGKCNSWYIDPTNSTCKEESSIALSKEARIAIGCTAGVITIATVVFWVFLFPKLFAAKQTAEPVRSVVV